MKKTIKIRPRKDRGRFKVDYRDHAGFRLYDLRHTYASLLLAEGAPITYVAAQFGHRKPTTTLRYYAHFIPREGRRWVNVLDFGAKLEPKSGTEGAQRHLTTTISDRTGTYGSVCAR